MVDVVTTNPNTRVSSGTVTVVDSHGNVISRTTYSGGHAVSHSGSYSHGGSSHSSSSSHRDSIGSGQWYVDSPSGTRYYFKTQQEANKFASNLRAFGKAYVNRLTSQGYSVGSGGRLVNKRKEAQKKINLQEKASKQRQQTFINAEKAIEKNNFLYNYRRGRTQLIGFMGSLYGKMYGGSQRMKAFGQGLGRTITSIATYPIDIYTIYKANQYAYSNVPKEVRNQLTFSKGVPLSAGKQTLKVSEMNLNADIITKDMSAFLEMSQPPKFKSEKEHPYFSGAGQLVGMGLGAWLYGEGVKVGVKSTVPIVQSAMEKHIAKQIAVTKTFGKGTGFAWEQDLGATKIQNTIGGSRSNYILTYQKGKTGFIGNGISESSYTAHTFPNSEVEGIGGGKSIGEIGISKITKEGIYPLGKSEFYSEQPFKYTFNKGITKFVGKSKGLSFFGKEIKIFNNKFGGEALTIKTSGLTETRFGMTTKSQSIGWGISGGKSGGSIGTFSNEIYTTQLPPKILPTKRLFTYSNAPKSLIPDFLSKSELTTFKFGAKPKINLMPSESEAGVMQVTKTATKSATKTMQVSTFDFSQSEISAMKSSFAKSVAENLAPKNARFFPTLLVPSGSGRSKQAVKVPQNKQPQSMADKITFDFLKNSIHIGKIENKQASIGATKINITPMQTTGTTNWIGYRQGQGISTGQITTGQTETPVEIPINPQPIVRPEPFKFNFPMQKIALPPLLPAFKISIHGLFGRKVPKMFSGLGKKYTPSPTAIFKGLTTTKKPSNKMWTGLEIRPIFTTSKKKKKKKGKKKKRRGVKIRTRRGK